MRCLIALAVALFVFASNGEAQTVDQTVKFSDTKSRQWSDSSGQNDMSARLISLDQQNKTVMLQADDATTVEVPLADLSISDRKYIKRQTSRVQRAARRDDHARRSEKKDSASESSLDTRRPDKGNRQADGAHRLYNIDWHVRPESARLAAAGKEGAKDDQPIMWFRVLGSLDGYM